jgi:hypothetical protein
VTPWLLAPPAAAACITFAYFVLRFFGAARRGWRLWDAIVLWHTLYWMGACALLRSESGATLPVFLAIVSLAQVSGVAGALVATAYMVRSPEPASVPLLQPREMNLAALMGIAASVVCTVFIVVVLRNEQLGLLLASVVLGEGGYRDYRIVLYSGESVYVAPGYIRQFRDVMLPSVLIAVAAYGPPRWRWLAIPLAVLGGVGAILSGERIVVMLFAFAIGAALVLRPHRRTYSRAALSMGVAAAVLAAFAGVTALLGRTVEGVDPGSAASTFAALVDRVILTLPRENLYSYQVWGEIGPTWGATWMNDFAGALPGVQRGLANQLADVQGMSILSGSPLGVAPDSYLAWGIVGTAALPFMYVAGLAYADHVLLRQPSALNQALRMVLVPWSFTWYSPFLFVLNGGFFLVAVVLARSTIPHARHWGGNPHALFLRTAESKASTGAE